MGYYDIAQVCLNGHMVNSRFRGSPEFSKRFCDKCGAETISRCPNCDMPIQGDYIVPGVIVLGDGPKSVPAYCRGCGKPFPWTQRRLQAIRELTEEADELDDEREDLIESLPDLMTATPRTEVAATKWRKALATVGEHVGPALKELLVDIAAESAKRLLLTGV